MDDWNGAVKELVVSYSSEPKLAVSICQKHVAKFMIGCLQNLDQGFMTLA